jgi:hypothetical protein
MNRKDEKINKSFAAPRLEKKCSHERIIQWGFLGEKKPSLEKQKR